MMKLLSLCYFVYFTAVSSGSPAPSFIVPCKPSDEACLVSSAQKAISYFAAGIPDLGVSPVDPLILDDVSAEEGDLKVQFKQLHITRTGQCQITKLSVGADITHLDIDLHCPITATGQYSASGKLLFVPIEGNGDCEIKTEKIKLSLKGHMDIVDGTDGKKHWHITDLPYTYEPEEQFFFRLDNLFEGDETKSKPVLEILNHSWKEVILSIGKPIIKEIVQKAKEHIDVFLAAVPSDALFLN